MSLKIKNAILQYPNLYEAKGYQDSKPVYSTKIILSKKDHKDTINEIKTALKSICEENKITFKPDSFKCFKDGELSGIDSYKDYYTLHAKANIGREPKVLDCDLTPYTGEVRSGAVANIVIDFWNYAFGGMSKGIACNLIAVQITHKTNKTFENVDNFIAENSFEKIEREMQEIPF